MKHKLFPHITGILVNEGESPSVIAVIAVTDQNESFPDEARIIIGSPEQSPGWTGDITPITGFGCSPKAARRLALTLLQAARDIEDSMGIIAVGSDDPQVSVVTNDLRTSEEALAFHAIVQVANLEQIKVLKAKLDELNSAMQAAPYPEGG